jgi:hypothetical protein
MKLFKHSDYDQYVKAQVDEHFSKPNRVWANEAEVKILSDYLKSKKKIIERGLCHGVRTGTEVMWFEKHTGASVIGTDIAPSEKSNVICWDFHKVKPEWIGYFDFIYSNSFDHSHSPEECLATWMSCLSPGGLCFVQWTRQSSQNPVIDAADCFSATLDEYKKIASRFNLVEVLIDRDIFASRRMILHWLVIANHIMLL